MKMFGGNKVNGPVVEFGYSKSSLMEYAYNPHARYPLEQGESFPQSLRLVREGLITFIGEVITTGSDYGWNINGVTQQLPKNKTLVDFRVSPLHLGHNQVLHYTLAPEDLNGSENLVSSLYKPEVSLGPVFSQRYNFEQDTFDLSMINPAEGINRFAGSEIYQELANKFFILAAEVLEAQQLFDVNQIRVDAKWGPLAGKKNKGFTGADFCITGFGKPGIRQPGQAYFIDGRLDPK